MRLVQALFSILWGLGYLGNGILFLYIEWTYLRQSFTQIFNPYLHLQVLGTLLITPLFWVFLGMAVVGYYATASIEKQFEKKELQSKTKTDKDVSTPSQVDQTIQSSILSPSSVQLDSKPVDDLGDWYDKQQVKLLEWAIQSSQKVQFTYENHDGEKVDHTVTPIGFKTVEQILCLEGYCDLRRARTTFAIRRIEGVRIIVPDETIYQSQSPFENIPKQVLSKDSPSQTSHQIPSPQKKADQTSYTETPSQKRPYIKYRFEEIEKVTDAEWNNVRTLSKIHHELEFRSRKKAQDLRERIAHRLIQLQNSQFAWPTTTAASGSKNLSRDVFKYEEGLLRQCGYKVGVKGLPKSRRWEILDSIFLKSLSFVDDTTYIREWGEPNTARRLQKMAESIAAFSRNAKRRNMSNFSKAIQDWEADLAYLKRTYYDGHFHFQWPHTGSSRL